MTSPFKDSNYYQKNFSGIILTNEHVIEKEFEECHFTKVHLIDCKIERCRFINCTFENSMVSAMKPVNSSFVDVEFKDSKVIGCDWTVAKKVDSLKFTNSDVSYSNFRFLKLPGLQLINCVATETDFTEADLSEGNFQGTDFEGARFPKTNLTKANFKKAKNYLIDIRSNTITKAQFSYPEAINLLKCLDISIEY